MDHAPEDQPIFVGRHYRHPVCTSNQTSSVAFCRLLPWDRLSNVRFRVRQKSSLALHRLGSSACSALSHVDASVKVLFRKRVSNKEEENPVFMDTQPKHVVLSVGSLVHTVFDI